MITAGNRLHSLRMVKLAIEKGFALKIVEVSCTYLEGTLDEDTNELFIWTTTVLCIHYASLIRNERYMVNRYLAHGEVFAAPMSEYDEYIEYNLEYQDDYYEYK